MKNADKPINPAFTVKSQEGNQMLATPEAANRGMINHANIGLTKREYFAAMAMQGFIAGRKDNFQSYTDNTLQMIAIKSITAADKLLKFFEKP